MRFMPETLKCINSIQRLEACATDEHPAQCSLELLSPPTEQLRFTAALGLAEARLAGRGYTRDQTM